MARLRDENDRSGGPPAIDPTELTTDAVNAARDQWRLDLQALREIIESRLDAIDRATDLRISEINRIFPSETEKMIQHMKDIHQLDIRTIDLRFGERDVRTQQAAESSQKALDAALLAAAALVAQQNDANSRAADKVELSFTKQFDQNAALLRTTQEGNDQKFADLKERIDRQEGNDVGARRSQTDYRNEKSDLRNEKSDSRSSVGVYIAIAGLFLTLIIVTVTIIVAFKP